MTECQQLELGITHQDPLFEAYMRAPGLCKRKKFKEAKEDALIGRCLAILSRRIEEKQHAKRNR